MLARLVWKAYFLIAPIRQMVVPQSGHFPFTIGLPFLVRPSLGSTMTFFALHFTQYASISISSSFPRKQACSAHARQSILHDSAKYYTHPYAFEMNG